MILSGIIRPDSGEARIDGMEIFENVNAKELFSIFLMTSISLTMLHQRK